MDESIVKFLEQPVEEWRDVLRRAADLIEEKGLWRGAAVGGYCVVTSMNKVCGGFGGQFDLALDRFASAVGLEDRARAVYRWNDARTAPEVIATLRAVAES